MSPVITPAETNPLTISGTNVTIMVADLDRSIRFYESVGLTLKQRWENHYALVETTGVTLGLHPCDEKDLNSGTVTIGFMAGSVDEARRLLELNKVVYREEEGKSGHYLHFTDPDGTGLYFVEPKWE